MISRVGRDYLAHPLRVAVLGASGYIGGEALRILLGHPAVDVVAATSANNAGQPVWSVHPNLNKVTPLEFTPEVLPEDAAELDAIFLALPHGEAMLRVPAIFAAVRDGDPGPVLFDLSGDFRLKDADAFATYYGIEHTAPEWAAQAAYGLTEWNRDAILRARLVACPGCFPTGALLALTPLARAGLLGGRVVVDSKTGSSGSGKEPGEGTHHPTRASDFRAYGVFKHRHSPEIAQELNRWRGSEGARITFTPHSAPMVRGIFTTAYVFPDREVGQLELRGLYEEAYGDEPFVRLVDAPRVAVVTHSNFCDISVATDGEGAVIVTSALDNLVKGGAGQGVQNMNVRFGLPERMGLAYPGTMP